MGFSILIVDDEPDLADLFRQRFRREVRQGHYVLHFATSGEEGLRRLAEIGPELIVILSDINMPGMDGLALLREIKRRRPELPVVMVTAYGDDERMRTREGARRRRLSCQTGRFRSAEAASGGADRRASPECMTAFAAIGRRDMLRRIRCLARGACAQLRPGNGKVREDVGGRQRKWLAAPTAAMLGLLVAGVAPSSALQMTPRRPTKTPSSPRTWPRCCATRER